MSRAFAIVPAAGHSVRMGQPKLLLPLEGKPLIEHAIGAWRQGEVERIVVVIRADDADLAAAVASLAVPNLELVRPEIPPPDMKASIQAALRHFADNYSPESSDCFLVAPADMPRLSPAIIRAVCREYIHQPGKIVVPVVDGRRGHPVLFPWSMAGAVLSLPVDAGLNILVDRGPTVETPSEILLGKDSQAFADIDTPEEYQRLVGE
jgi:molybdenum cofactor cytidylyltransferase